MRIPALGAMLQQEARQVVNMALEVGLDALGSSAGMEDNSINSKAMEYALDEVEALFKSKTFISTSIEMWKESNPDAPKKSW